MKKLTINRIASAALRTNKKSYVALAIGIFLSIFLVTAMCLGVHGLFMANETRRDARLGSQDAFWLDCGETDETLMSTGLYSTIGHVTIPAVHNDTSTSVGYYDDTAAAFLHRSFIEGCMPEKPGEIAIEESALARLRIDGVTVGDTITLTLTPVQGVEETRSFTLVGILVDQSAGMEGYNVYYQHYDHFPAMLIHPEEPAFATGRLVQHKLFSFAPGVTGFAALNHYIRVDAEGNVWHGDLMVFDGYDNPTYYPNDLLMPNPDVLTYSVCVALLAGALLLATCVGIAGAMESQLSRKVTEIGMLRAVGATKKQIRRIFGREALLLALIVSPAAILAGCGAAWTLAKIAPAYFLFRPAWWLLLPVAVISIVTILLAGGLPLRRASSVTPMAVMRDTGMLRRLRRIRPKMVFRPERLVAWRQLSIRPGQQAAPALLMALMMAIVSLTSIVLGDTLSSAISLPVERPSFSIDGMGVYHGGFHDQTPGQQLTLSDIAQMRTLPGVKRVEWEGGIRVIQELGEDVPAYWTPVYYPVTYENGYTAHHNLGNGHAFLLPAEERPEGVYRDEADYMALRQYLSVTGHLGSDIHLDIAVIDPAGLEKYVVSGKIDLSAINAGQEVLVVAPTVYTFLSPDGALNTFRGSDAHWVQNRLEDPGYTLLAAIKNDAYTAGQTLTLHYIHSDSVVLPANGTVEDYLTGYEQMEHETAQVKVGAVLNGGFVAGDHIVMVTTEQGLVNMGFPLTRVELVSIYTGELTPEEEAVLEKRISAIAMRGAGYTVNNLLEGKRGADRTRVFELLLLVGVSLILLTVCVAQVTGSVSRRIRAEARMIGTLRAVGADARVIFRCYSGQVIMSVAIGTVIGLAIYWGILYRIPYMQWSAGKGNWGPLTAQIFFAVLTLLASLLILRLRIRDVTRHSIVENIREL